MRVWGRVNGQWVAAETSPAGDNSAPILTWLIQVLKLNQQESPLFANWGIPAQQSVMAQIQPDMAVTQTQQRFAQYFASLIVTKALQQPNQPQPVYNIALTTLQGASVPNPIPT